MVAQELTFLTLKTLFGNLKYLWILKLSGYFEYHQVEHTQILRSAHTVHLCVFVWI